MTNWNQPPPGSDPHLDGASTYPRRPAPTTHTVKPGANYTQLKVYTEDKGGPQFTATFNAGDIGITGGGAGWQSVQRPRRSPATVWRGAQETYTMEIPLVFDLFATGNDVEGHCRALEMMAGILVADYQQPPLLILDANGALPNDVFNFPPLRWFIPEPPVLGKAIRKRNDGKRERQEFTVKFAHYVAYDELTRSKTIPPSTGFTIARSGDTFKKIAARELSRWGGVRWANRLAQYNGFRDGRSKPLPGQLVKLPTVAQIQTWTSTPRR